MQLTLDFVGTKETVLDGLRAYEPGQIDAEANACEAAIRDAIATYLAGKAADGRLTHVTVSATATYTVKE
jgi:hypothetical protein